MTGTHRIITGEVLDALRSMPDNSADAVLSDVPYGLGPREPTPQELAAYILGDTSLDLGGDFMAKEWEIPSVAIWREVLRVLKPGAPVLAFAGSRTFDLVVIGLRAAGFEIRDSLMWLYAKGFPKSLNVGKALDEAAGAERQVIGTRTLQGNAALSCKEKGGTYASVGLDSSGRSVEVPITAPATELAQQWDGYGTAMKPAYEPIVLARKPLDGTVAANVARWGVGGLAIDACRISTADPLMRVDHAPKFTGTAYNGGRQSDPAGGHLHGSEDGRWPANLLFDEDAAAIFDAEVGPRKSGVAVRRNGGGGQIFSGIGGNEFKPKPNLPDVGYLDGATNPSRFFFSSKVSRAEREFGCEALPLRSAGEATDREEDTDGLNSPRAGAGRTGGARNFHPCLKPISLNRYLATLILPPQGRTRRLLVPYCGSGSEIIGAIRAGWDEVIGIERDPDYVKIAEARIARWAQVPTDLEEGEAVRKSEAVNDNQTSLFGIAR